LRETGKEAGGRGAKRSYSSANSERLAGDPGEMSKMTPPERDISVRTSLTRERLKVKFGTRLDLLKRNVERWFEKGVQSYVS